MKPTHPAYDNLRQAVHILCTSPEPIQTRLQEAEHHLPEQMDGFPASDAEWNLYHRILSSLVESGTDDENEPIAAAIAALPERRAIDIATDILRLFELLANIAPDDAPWMWRRR
ncbi:MAG TPA: hypothetical protein VK778_10595 [Solirubrobacteraceae bacterium]|jgi:hypothetical protein|nr:hypothetical protein [Solirubrobacteraceae bacterium]